LRRYEATSSVPPGPLADLLIVSGVTLAEANGESRVVVRRADGVKCGRCWKISEEVGKLAAHPAVCARCAEVLERP
jgi:isoleucyl-tRNA synthetase